MPDTSLLPILPLSQEEIKARDAQRHELLWRLDSKQTSIKAQAIVECRNLPASEICALLHMADVPMHAKIPPHIRQRIGIATLLGLVLVFLVLLYLAYSNNDTSFILPFPILCIISLSLLTAYNGKKLYSAHLQNSLAVVVSHVQDPALLPEAIRVLNSARPIYYGDLTPLKQAFFDRAAYFLQKLDIQQIRSYGIQQQALCLFLEPQVRRKQSGAAICVLNYLEWFGTSSALFQVSCIANTNLSRQEDEKVREAAQTCLAALANRAQARSQSQVLLRAADAPTAAIDALLRPATAQTSHAEPDTLLRSSNSRQSGPPISGKIINGNSETL